jgi:hypothetical protein
VSPLAPTGLVHSIQTRLANLARATGRPYAELLGLFAIERFLHRLGRSRHHDRFVLKGALLLRGWLGTDTRPTRDIDLLGSTDMDAAGLQGLLEDILRTEVEDDGIELDVDSISVRPIRLQSPVLGLRARFEGHLGRTILRYQVDVGLGDAVYPPPEEIVPGDILGLPMATVRAYTAYTTISEKLEAIVVLGYSNSRIKDHYDLAHLTRALPFDGPILVESIRRTFERRHTPIPAGTPEGLSDTFAQEPLNVARWRAFLAKSRLKEVELDLGATIAAIRTFALPVLDAALVVGPLPVVWPPGGPWR